MGAYALRLTGACLIAGAIRIIGYGAQSMVARNPSLWFVIYLIPILTTVLAVMEFDGARLSGFFERWRSPLPIPEPAA